MLAPNSLRRTQTMDDLYEYLRKSRLFACLSHGQTQAVAKAAWTRPLSAKTRVSVPPSEQRVHLMLRGQAKVSYLARDRKQPILYFVNPGELVGEQSIFHGPTHDDHVETMEASVVASVPTALLRDLVLQEPAFSMAVCELISRRRTQIENRLRNLLYLSNRERLVHLLLDLAEQYGEGHPDFLWLRIKLSHQDLAHCIGSTRETVTVVLGKMQSEGLLKVRRRGITLLDAESLALQAGRRLVLNGAASSRWFID